MVLGLIDYRIEFVRVQACQVIVLGCTDRELRVEYRQRCFLAMDFVVVLELNLVQKFKKSKQI